MDVLFKIGEIADMFDASVRALHLYDKMDLFKPEYTDPETGYRYYTADQFPILNTILVFKAIGIKLIDIKNLLDNGINAEELIEVMQRKRKYWEDQIEISKFNIECIKNIENAAIVKIEQQPDNDSGDIDAFKMSKLVCLENTKIQGFLSQILWL